MQAAYSKVVVWLCVLTLAGVFAFACMGGGGGRGRCARAVAGCECYPNGTCESGYACGSDNVCTGDGNDGDASIIGGNGSQCDAPSGCLDAGTGSGGAGSGNGGAAGNTAVAGGAGAVGAGGVPVGGAGGSGGGGGASAGSGGQGGASAGAGGASGGSSGAAGTGGSGGQPAANCGGGVPTMIDDFEDGDDYICQNDARSGRWYVYTTGNTVITPAGSPVNPQLLPAPVGSSTRAMHFVSTGDFPSALGFSLIGVGPAALPYSATIFSGIRFRASTELLDDFSLEVQTTLTDTVANGGVCDSNCVANRAYKPIFSGSDVYEILFEDLVSGSSPFDPADIRSITFVFGQNTDMWIDDIEFF